MKKRLIFVIFLFFTVMVKSQELNTLGINDWNTLRKSGFYESLTSNTLNSPGNQMYYWGMNIGHTGNLNTSKVYHYNGQIAFAVNYTVTYPQVYVRSTYITGEGTWAKLLHSKGDHAIDGKLTVKEVQIKVNTGADFVFQSDYNLKPLSEVEAFVKENKHLPEIPSERQMIEEGVNVTDMQIKLLQKIEELTLYMIEQDKENKEQRKQIELQSEQIKHLQELVGNTK